MPRKNAGTKRKAPLVASDSNAGPPAKKVAKGKSMATSTASGSTTEISGKVYKYSEPSSLEKDLPEMCTVIWPHGDDEDEDEDDAEQRVETAKEKSCDKDGEEEHPREVTDKGFPITKAGMDMFLHIIDEQEKRDQDNFHMHIYNDWNGYGLTEVLENLLVDFNKLLFKKDVSPMKKWAYIEGLVTWLQVGDLYSLMMNDNSEGIGELFKFFITLAITSYEVLAEHTLIGPTSAVPNVSVLTQIMIKFLSKDAGDFEIEGVEEIVRAADKAGVAWDYRKEIGIEEEIEEMRESNKGSNARKMDWKKAFTAFKRNHPGGRKYDITKMSNAEKKEHEF